MFGRDGVDHPSGRRGDRRDVLRRKETMMDINDILKTYAVFGLIGFALVFAVGAVQIVGFIVDWVKDMRSGGDDV